MESVTVIMPVYNEGKYIEQSIYAIINQDYGGSMEIIIADGNSSDSTRETITRFQQKHPNIQIVDNQKKIVPTGMNAALGRATGDIIVRVDGHCIIAKDYIRRCIGHIREDKVDAVGGPMRTIGENLISEVIAFAMSSSFGVGNSSFRTEAGKTKFVDTVPFPAYTRTIIQKVGFYDEELVRNQDDEYNYRIRRAGGKVLLAADVQSEYYSRGSLLKLWTQYFQYGFWKVRVLQKHPKQMSFRQFIPPTFVAALLISLLGIPFHSFFGILLGIVIGSYLVVNLMLSAHAALKKRWQYLLILPVCYMVLHLSYGLGFLYGLCAFWNRWNDRFGKVPVNILLDA